MKQSFCIHNATVIAGYARMDRSAVFVEGESIADVFSERRFAQRTFPSDVELIDAKGGFLTPGLIDTHIHGIGGFGTEDMSTDALLQMSQILPAWGVTSFIPTIYPMPEEEMVRAIKGVVAAMGHEPGRPDTRRPSRRPIYFTSKAWCATSGILRPVDLGLMQRLVGCCGRPYCKYDRCPGTKRHAGACAVLQ